MFQQKGGGGIKIVENHVEVLFYMICFKHIYI